MHRGGARLEDMETTRIPLVLALGALTAWSAKAVTVGLDDGADSGTATALMVIGLAFALAAGVAVALALSRGRPGRHRFAAVVVGLVAGPAIALPLNLAIESVVESDHWAWAEVNLWVMAIVLVAVAGWTTRRTDPASRPSAPAHSVDGTVDALP